ncbi:MaoC family dehydratase [Candidatus Nitrosotenuis cloacae]|uniref:MaoC family dehydratase n=1 Tax=Candidatus Nitrosotenuis cloacae TaxID=1603555 RepID=UPI00228017E8|nr:MaoC family dehydratase [Candidatus Nitrosotenuis cloacae]
MTENIPSHSFDEIKIGTKARFTVTIDENMITDFASVSGDYNPLHMDENYARTTNFKKRVCHGMLLGSFFSRLVGMHLPGKNSLYFSQTLNFQAPCFVGETVFIEGEVTDKSESTRIITIKTVAYDHLGKCLVDGIAKVMVRDNLG